MKIYNWLEYRIPGLITIALSNDAIPEKYKYKIVGQDYEVQAQKQKDEQYLIPSEPLIKELREIQVKAFLRSIHKIDFGHDWHTLFDLIYNFGGVNLNPESKGFLAFIPLTKTKDGGLDWDTHEKEIKPTVSIPRRSR